MKIKTVSCSRPDVMFMIFAERQPIPPVFSDERPNRLEEQHSEATSNICSILMIMMLCLQANQWSMTMIFSSTPHADHLQDSFCIFSATCHHFSASSVNGGSYWATCSVVSQDMPSMPSCIGAFRATQPCPSALS